MNNDIIKLLNLEDDCIITSVNISNDRTKVVSEVKEIIDDWIDYYNNERYQWNLAKLAPNEYYTYITTGIYPLKK